MPTMEHIDSLRAGSHHTNVAVKALNKKAYFFFFEHLLENVAGKQLWKKQKYMAEVSKCVSVLDEGYCLLLLLNSYQLYAEQATKEKGDKCVVKPKYTGQHGSNKRFEGWTHEGLLAYNDICQKLVKDRRDNKVLDEEFLAYMKAKKAGSVKKRKKEVDNNKRFECKPFWLYNDFAVIESGNGMHSGQQAEYGRGKSDDNDDKDIYGAPRNNNDSNQAGMNTAAV